MVAWHEVPGTASPQRNRPVGYGVIRAGLRPDSRIGVISLPLRNTTHILMRNTSGTRSARHHTVPYGTVLLGYGFSRHFVPGYDRPVPPGHFATGSS
jgi:hypothetical protein